jgi:hypothetical protein
MADETSNTGTTRLLPSALVAGLVVAFWLVGHFAAGGKPSDWDSFDWAAATGAATAYGTLALALVTWRLVVLTRADASGTLELARLAEREQEERARSVRRERILRIVDAVNQLVEAAILAGEIPGQLHTAVPNAQARLRTAIALSGLPIGELGSTDLLLRTPYEKVKDQAQSATLEIQALLSAIDSVT